MIKDFFYRIHLKLAMKALKVLIDRQDPKVYGPIQAAAKKLGYKFAMDYFDQKRINHCAECPETGQLLVVSKRYLCPDHARQIGSPAGIRIAGQKEDFKPKVPA